MVKLYYIEISREKNCIYSITTPLPHQLLRTHPNIKSSLYEKHVNLTCLYVGHFGCQNCRKERRIDRPTDKPTDGGAWRRFPQFNKNKHQSGPHRHYGWRGDAIPNVSGFLLFSYSVVQLKFGVKTTPDSNSISYTSYHHHQHGANSKTTYNYSTARRGKFAPVQPFAPNFLLK